MTMIFIERLSFVIHLIFTSYVFNKLLPVPYHKSTRTVRALNQFFSMANVYPFWPVVIFTAVAQSAQLHSESH